MHADFDAPGLRIAARVMQDHGAVPWRFGAVDYEAAAGVMRGQPLEGDPVAYRDEALGPVMRRVGQAIAEEALADVLLPDLEG